jgi:hypothetical protein
MSNIVTSNEVSDREKQMENKTRTNIGNIIDNINLNNLNNYYQKDDTLFKKRIDNLNMKFYLSTEKYLTAQSGEKEKYVDHLFLILFKQISIYIEEIERLNLIIKSKEESEKSTLVKLDEINQRERERISTQTLVTNLRATNKMLSEKINEKCHIEEKLNQTIESLKRQIKVYTDKLQLDLNSKRGFENLNKTRTGNISHKNLEDFINPNNSSLSTHENNTHIRSQSKDSSGNTIVYSSQNMNQRNLTNEKNVAFDFPIEGGNESLNSSNASPNKHSSSAFNKSLSKILSKKRNYSDNNPITHQKQKSGGGSQTTQQNIQQNTLKREITKSSLNQKNKIEINLEIRSPGKGAGVMHNYSNSHQIPLNNGGKTLPMKSSLKNFSHMKDMRIIKTIKQKNRGIIK